MEPRHELQLTIRKLSCIRIVHGMHRVQNYLAVYWMHATIAANTFVCTIARRESLLSSIAFIVRHELVGRIYLVDFWQILCSSHFAQNPCVNVSFWSVAFSQCIAMLVGWYLIWTDNVFSVFFSTCIIPKCKRSKFSHRIFAIFNRHLKSARFESMLLNRRCEFHIVEMFLWMLKI